MLIGEYVRLKRAERRLTQDQLSKITGINRSYLSRLEKGHFKNPSLSVITKLAAGLNIYTEDLIKIVDIDAKIIQPDMLLPFEEYIALKFKLSQQTDIDVISDLTRDFYKSYFKRLGLFPKSETRDAQYIKISLLYKFAIDDFEKDLIDDTARGKIFHLLEPTNFSQMPGEPRLSFPEIEEHIDMATKEYKLAKKSHEEKSK